jgi:hypothetical protein
MKKNEFIINGNITKIIIKSSKYGYFEAFIDTFNLDLVKNYCWHVHFEKHINGFYVVTNTSRLENYDKKQTRIILHRLITNCPKGLMVDHINHNTLDNRRENLRVCKNKENMENLIKAQINNKSCGVLGVHYHKRDKVYQAQISHNNKRIYLGSYSNMDEAKKAYEDAKEKYFSPIKVNDNA